MADNYQGDQIKEESSWSYPLGILLATLTLSAGFLFYYFGPRLNDIAGDTPKPTISEDVIALAIGGTEFYVPANHTVFPRARRSGTRDKVELYALWPNLSPYTPARRRDFVENHKNTRRINISIKQFTPTFGEVERFERVYLPRVVDTAGEATAMGLKKYVFKQESADAGYLGYKDEDLYVGDTLEGDTMVLRCFKGDAGLPSPNCRRDFELNGTVSVSYTFKTPYLSEWQAIDARVRDFVAGLQNEPRSQAAATPAALEEDEAP